MLRHHIGLRHLLVAFRLHLRGGGLPVRGDRCGLDLGIVVERLVVELLLQLLDHLLHLCHARVFARAVVDEALAVLIAQKAEDFLADFVHFQARRGRRDDLGVSGDPLQQTLQLGHRVGRAHAHVYVQRQLLRGIERGVVARRGGLASGCTFL